MKKLLPKLIALFTICTLGISGLIVTPTFADDICTNANVSKEVQAAAGCPNVPKVNDLPTTIKNIIEGVIAAIGTLCVIFVLIGAVNYITSTGDTAKVEKAKKTILYAAIGLVISALTFAIVNWTIDLVTESETATQTQGQVPTQEPNLS